MSDDKKKVEVPKDQRTPYSEAFENAAEIVQGLPKKGPVQAGYQEMLILYGSYKQVMNGTVTSPRPGIWDMLGRAKWDAWAKMKGDPDSDPIEVAKAAEKQYVLNFLKVYEKAGTEAQKLPRDALDRIEKLEKLVETLGIASLGYDLE